jgi:hypothetical protein
MHCSSFFLPTLNELRTPSGQRKGAENSWAQLKSGPMKKIIFRLSRFAQAQEDCEPHSRTPRPKKFVVDPAQQKIENRQE